MPPQDLGNCAALGQKADKKKSYKRNPYCIQVAPVISQTQRLHSLSIQVGHFKGSAAKYK